MNTITLQPADPVRHLFILSGQSNMRPPLIPSFQEAVKGVLGEDKVVVVAVARPRQPILRWCKDWTPPDGGAPPEGRGTLYDELIRSVRSSIANMEIASVTFVWMQGEADAGSGWAGVYEKSFFGILDQLKQDLGVKEINFVVGRINDFWLPDKGVVDGDKIRAIQVNMAEEHAEGEWVDTDDLNTGTNPWGIYEIDGGHFPDDAYRVLGQRFAAKAARLADKDAVLDGRFFGAVFIDDAAKVKTNLAQGKKVTGPVPAKGGKLEALTDGNLGGKDARDAAWLTFLPSKDRHTFHDGKESGGNASSVEMVFSQIFTIDLGASAKVGSVVLNLLADPAVPARFPEGISVGVSADGTEYRSLLAGRSETLTFSKPTVQRSMEKGFAPQAFYVQIGNREIEGRYVKVEVTPVRTGEAALMIDEIMVNPLPE